MNRFNSSKLAVILATVFASSVSFAQAAPTTATALAAAVDMSDAKAAGLTIIGLLVAAGVVLWGARLVLSKFAPRV